MHRSLFFALFVLFAAGCLRDGMIYGGPPDDGGALGGGFGTGGGTGTGGGAAGDLPCDVANLLTTHCASCHGVPLSGGAPMSLLTRDELAAASPIYSGKTYADRSLVRMQQAVAAMPPAPAAAVPSADIAAFQAWIQAGLPAGSCGLDAGTGGGAGGGGGGGGGGNSYDGGVGGLPCDVAALIETKCVTCHHTPLAGGAPYPLTSYAELVAAAPGFPGQTVAERSLVRAQDTVAPMPPAGNTGATPQEIAALAAWIDAGTPQGMCGEVDAGSTTPTCASGNYWTGGNNGSSRMNPGLACVSCHNQQQPEAAYYFMGTVFPGMHEKDLCDAPPPAGGTVQIIDANGNVALTLTPNSVGNFYSQSYSAGLALPYTARVSLNGNVRTMTTPQTDGDCNTCHTVQGINGAPGRITWP